MNFWQHSNFSWRTVKPGSQKGVDYEITINVEELNGGVIPTAPNQGKYSTTDDYYSEMSNLLGVDVTTDTYFLTVIGSSIKQTQSGDPTLGSTGDFVYDALSNEDGRTIIDDVDVTLDILHRNQIHQFEQAIDKGNGAVPLSTNSSLNQYAGPPLELEDSTILSSGLWAADLDLLARGFELDHDVVYPGIISTNISSVRENTSISCFWIWDPATETLTRQCHEADILAVELELPNGAGTTNLDPLYQQDSSFNSTAISLSFGWAGGTQLTIPDACGYGTAFFDISESEIGEGLVSTQGTNPSDCSIIGN